MTPARDVVTLPAPAKINLSLHVCGKRADGYHLLDSLVCFAGVADVVTARRAVDFKLDVTGPFAGVLQPDDDNLVLRAGRFLAARTRSSSTSPHGAHLTLEKHLPVAAGIGGGSSDAATTLIACAQLWNVDAAHIPSDQIAAALGADVPVCLARAPMRMMGIGDRLEAVAPLPSAWLLLVNPQRPLSTKTVFSALQGRHSGPMPVLPSRFATARDLATYLMTCTNDLMRPAEEALPDIGAVLAAIRGTEGSLLARLSGSGPTCFGLFESRSQAEAAAKLVATAQPEWWVAPAPMLTSADDPFLGL